MKTWVQHSDFEMAIDDQIAEIKMINIKKCPMQRCNLSFIDEWAHHWDFHPDSSSHHWVTGPETVAFLKTTNKTMSSKEGSNPGHLAAQIKKETEADESMFNIETHEESSETHEVSSDPRYTRETEKKSE